MTTNGYFSIGATPRHAELFSFPSSYGFLVVAPFANDATISNTGYVRYSESFTNSELNEVSEFIHSETEISFSGTWMLVAEWNGVPLDSETSVNMVLL